MHIGVDIEKRLAEGEVKCFGHSYIEWLSSGYENNYFHFKMQEMGLDHDETLNILSELVRQEPDTFEKYLELKDFVDSHPTFEIICTKRTGKHEQDRLTKFQRAGTYVVKLKISKY